MLTMLKNHTKSLLDFISIAYDHRVTLIPYFLELFIGCHEKYSANYAEHLVSILL
jgi:hypothetical protein